MSHYVTQLFTYNIYIHNVTICNNCLHTINIYTMSLYVTIVYIQYIIKKIKKLIYILCTMYYVLCMYVLKNNLNYKNK